VVERFYECVACKQKRKRVRIPGSNGWGRRSFAPAICAEPSRCGPNLEKHSDWIASHTTTILDSIYDMFHTLHSRARRCKHNITQTCAESPYSMPRLNKRAQREKDALASLQQGTPGGPSDSDSEESEPEVRSKLGFTSVCTTRRRLRAIMLTTSVISASGG